jgi:serine/threonine protein kinase/Tol biopolymer transport system component/tetratricopeptide (TPR) repeat protein
MKREARPSAPEDRTTASTPPWSEVKALFEAALDFQGKDRELFLERSCADSWQLKEEIESLLKSYEETDGFLDQPIVSVQALLDSDPSSPPEETEPVEADTLIGARIGAYRVEKEIGRGGMGEVYLATRADSEFDKRVAIKLIRDGSPTGLGIRRFRRERQILARLENAYIARLLDGGTTSHGLPYFVMEYVEGKPIHRYCDENSLTIRERLALFLKVCSAVKYAHERNIIHRDLKPGNILVKCDGTPKLLDFGIAKILGAESSGPDQDATHHTLRMLTPAYASPEQLRGGTATVKSDIYSLGIVLYELLCGKRPDDAYFRRSETTSLPCPHEAHLSAQLRAILLRCIHPDPAERYVSVENFAADLRRYLSGAPPLADTPESMRESPSRVSLAVVPFRILGDQNSSNAFLAPGLTETLITKLSRIERLSVSPPSAVLKYADGVEAVRAARELHVEYILEGSLYLFGESVRASVQLVFAEAGIAVWAGQVEATEKTLVKLGDSIAEQVAAAVLPHLTGEERAEINRSGTNNGAAYAAYLRGRWHWTSAAGEQEKLLKALVCFREAIDLDPKFARAHSGVAEYYLRMGLWGGLPPTESFAAAIQSAQTAVQLEPTLAEAHASLAFAIWAYHRDEEAAEKHFSLAIVRNPNYASAHHWFGLLNSARNRPELAIANLERASKVDPNSVLIAAALGFVHYNARQFDTALRLLLNAARELPKSGIVQEMLARCYLQTGDVAAALECANRAVQLGNSGSAALSTLAHAEAAAGNMAAAVQLRNDIEERTKKMYVSSYDRASAALAVGQTQQALHHLEQARDGRDWWFCWIEVDPRWDPLRNEARFKKLLPKRGSPAGPRFAPVYAAVACALILIAVCAAWWMARRPALPFTNVKFTKLTTNGTAESAAVSPDGQAVVYAAKEPAGMAIWRYDRQTGRVVKLIDRLSGKLMDLGFTARGSAVQFVTFPVKDPATRTLYTLPIAGGSPAPFKQTFPGPVSLSSDASQAAFFFSDLIHGADELFQLDVKSGARHLLASYKYPLRFAWNCRPAWSSNGRQIAYAAEERDNIGFVVRLHVLDVATGARHDVSSPRWQWVESIEWTHDNSALAVIGQEHESSFQQVWYVPYPASRGGVRRIGNDLDSYIGASLTANGSEIVSVQSQTLSNVYIAKQNDLSHPLQVTPGNGRYFDLAWIPDGRILYASDATGSADLWVMNQDGTGQRQITFGTGRNYAPVASPDARMVAFHSNRSGNWQVWRTNLDGTDPKQLSSTAGDGNWPRFTADGKAVLFHKTNPNGVFNLWQVPVAGGEAQQLTTALTMHPAVSPATGQIAAWYSDTADTPNWKLAIFAPSGGDPLRVLNPTPNSRPDTPLRWMPKGDAISLLDYAHSASNIYAVPLDGYPPRALTSFDSGEIYSFDWSPQGDLIYSRGLTTADVVLIRDLNASQSKK